MPVRIPILTTNLSLEQVAAHGDGDSLNGDGDGSGRFGVPGLAAMDGVENPPRPVDRSKKPGETKQIEQPQRATPLKVSAGVLQGKAIDRMTPVYPQIARAIHREGSVLVEVMISPEGRVESARALSGDPLLAKSAVDAAYGWRFQPTYLGDVPVRVTGMITFVFRLGD
jgi:TonB family protein